jgi:hypoxanthine phosphoribosyltransferase
MQFGATYFRDAFKHNSDLLDKAQENLKGVYFDTLIGTGLSGSLVVPIMAHFFEVDFAIVRKEPSSHDNSIVVGNIGRKWIFVDDMISSGKTLERVKAVMSELTYVNWDVSTYPNLPYPTTYVGAYLYNDGLWQPECPITKIVKCSSTLPDRELDLTENHSERR